jgi:pimeloyl-ACP methyl ester carboxylesterase
MGLFFDFEAKNTDSQRLIYKERSMQIVFLPGFMCDERLFAAQMTALSDAGFDCRFATLSDQETIADMAAHVLRSHEGDLFLVGLSMGGIVALEAVRQAPDRVTGLALLNTTPFEDSLGETRLQQIADVQRDGIEDLYVQVLKPVYIAPENRHKQLMDLVVAMARDLGPDVFERQSTALAARSSFEEDLPTIKQASLVLTGAADAVCGEETAQYLQAQLPDASLTVVANCGHLSTLEQPAHVSAALITFLREL